MADNKFIESLHLEENVFELRENCIISYLVHYCAPFTGSGEFEIPLGTKFSLLGPMRDDAMYLHLIVDDNNVLVDEITKNEQNKIPKLSTRLSGLSFFITEKQLTSLPLKFLSGSKERCLEILALLRTN